MKIPKGLQPLIDDGIVDAVIRPLKSGKEASVYLVACGNHIRCAKVYKAIEQRSFHKLAEYQEGRKTRSSRDQRAIGKRSKHGRNVEQTAWKNAEVDALYLLDAAGVRVPKPHGFVDGVLLMELITGADGQAAPRLNDVEPTAEEARAWHDFLITQVVRMLCSGLVHGDLSEFNVLVGTDGLVIIDLPQAVNAAGNNNAFKMLERDVNNIRAYCGRFAPELLATEYAHEIWELFKSHRLRPDSRLTGRFVHDETAADVDAVMHQIEEARKEAERRQRGREEAEAGLVD
ncbi:MAG: PA4780 family RIO1-like protein kinase [Porticoccaceae bacterium]